MHDSRIYVYTPLLFAFEIGFYVVPCHVTLLCSLDRKNMESLAPVKLVATVQVIISAPLISLTFFLYSPLISTI